jgi:hypothetical protein
MKKYIFAMAMMCSMLFYGQGEGGVFTSQRLAALRTGEGSLGNNPSAINWFEDLRNKTAKLGMDKKLTLDDIQGTVYYKENFEKGNIYYRYKLYGEYLLRYDAFNDEVELKKGELDQVEALHKNEAISCRINGEKFEYGTFKNLSGEVEKGYLIPLFEGNRFALYMRKLKIFKEGKPAKTSLQNPFPHRFLDQRTYLVASDNKMPGEIKTSKKEIMRLVEVDKRDSLKNFLKDKNIDLRDKNGLLQAITFIDQL